MNTPPGIAANSRNIQPLQKENPQHQPLTPQPKNEKDQHVNSNIYPTLIPAIGLCLFIMNIFIPGSGTIVAGCMSPKNRCCLILCGIAQLFLAVIIIGWVWSCVSGYQIFRRSREVRFMQL